MVEGQTVWLSFYDDSGNTTFTDSFSILPQPHDSTSLSTLLGQKKVMTALANSANSGMNNNITTLKSNVTKECHKSFFSEEF